jgi:tetratricopeptide (TPR) repeat protein
VLYRPQFSGLHNYLYNQSRFRLAYLDAVAAVYINRQIDSSSLIQKVSAASPPSALAHFTQVLNPFFSFGAYDSKANFDYLYASYYTNVGDFAKAEKFAQASLNYGDSHFEGNQALGELNYQKALHTTDANEKQNLLNNAGNFYQQSLNEKPDFAASWLGIGAVYFQQKNFQKGLESFEQVIAIDKDNLTAYNFAAECCKHFINQNVDAQAYTQKAIDFYRKADKLNPDNPTILSNLGFLYFRNNDCDNTKKYLSKVVNFEGLTEQQRNSARECLKKCTP